MSSCASKTQQQSQLPAPKETSKKAGTGFTAQIRKEYLRCVRILVPMASDACLMTATAKATSELSTNSLAGTLSSAGNDFESKKVRSREREKARGLSRLFRVVNLKGTPTPRSHSLPCTWHGLQPAQVHLLRGELVEHDLRASLLRK